MISQVRKCPGCGKEHSEEIILCPSTGWDLTQEPLRLPGQVDEPPPPELAPVATVLRCPNGHPIELGDEICLECGEGVEKSCPVRTPPAETIIDGWTVVDVISKPTESYEQFVVERNGHQALLSLYRQGAHSDPAISEALKRLPREYTPEIQAEGEWKERHYEVAGSTSDENLLDIFPHLSATPQTFQQIVKSVGRILFTMGRLGLRHCNIRPENILVRSRNPLDLYLTGLQYARLSAFDLDSIFQPASSWYLAPEVIAGGVSIASDWWSLGMVLLQLATKGRCFEGINEKAFRIHVVTRGVAIPKGLDPEVNTLFLGLLARDPDKRWQWPQIQGWLAGESIDVPADAAEEEKKGPPIELNGRTFFCPKAFALAGAEAQNWETGRDLLMRGVIATWLEERRIDAKIIAGVRLATSLESVAEDFRYSLSLMWLNPNLPLTLKGEIINPSWLLQNASQGYEIITGPIAIHLRQLNREPQICELHDRAQHAREKASSLGIELDEESFRIFSLTSSRNNLEKRWASHRRLYPGSDHNGLNSLMKRQKISNEDLIILLGATTQQYESAEQLLTKAADIASQVRITIFDRIAAEKWFEISRRELLREIEKRLANYARCGIPRADEWADEFRINRGISLPRALVMLAIPPETWKEPPRQQYVATILEFFEKRKANLAQRGPLVRLTIGKTSSRIDVSHIEGRKHSAISIVDHIVSRTDTPSNIDRAAFEEDPNLVRRLRHLVVRAMTHRRETGIDSLYLGFPFIVMRDRRAENSGTKPRIAPILLWPIQIDLGTRGNPSIFFDRDREEVRLNPALPSLVGSEEERRWREVADELLGRSSLRLIDVIDAFGSLIEPRERSLCELPNKDYNIAPGVRQVVCSAVLFHTEFSGQAIGEDLRQLRRREIAGTGLETALRLGGDLITPPPVPLVPEEDRYLVVESDPSQERAVFQGRQAPGLLIEGPPGTGKSQTIVNIVADCIGRKQNVLIVCQKQAALEVLAKRLEAEGLANRFFYITNVHKDRTPTIQALRGQIDTLDQSVSEFIREDVTGERLRLARKIEKLEMEINQHHLAIYTKDETTGLNYRSLLGQLIEFEDGDQKLIDVPALRALLVRYDQNQLSAIADACAPLANIWLDSQFEGSSLVNIKPFSSDTAWIEEFSRNLHLFIELEKARDEVNRLSSTPVFDIDDALPHQTWISTHHEIFASLNEKAWKNLSAWRDLFRTDILGRSRGREAINSLEGMKQQIGEFVKDFAAFVQAEEKRDKTIKMSITYFDVDDILPHRSWIDENDKLFRNMNSSEWKNLSAWFNYFSLEDQSPSIGSATIERLEAFKQALSSPSLESIDSQLSDKLAEVPTSLVEKWLALSNEMACPNSFFGRIWLIRDLRRRRLHKILKEMNEEVSDQKINEFRKTVGAECHLRPVRKGVFEILDFLHPELNNNTSLSAMELKETVNQLLRELRLASVAVQAVIGAPRLEDAVSMARLGGLQGYLEMLLRYEGAFLRCKARNESHEALEQLNGFFPDSWISSCSLTIDQNLTNLPRLQSIIECLPFLDARSSVGFQELSDGKIKEFFSGHSDMNSYGQALLPLRENLFDITARFYPSARQISTLPPLEIIQQMINALLHELRLIEVAAQAIQLAPRTGDAEAMAQIGRPDAYLELRARYEEAFKRHKARNMSLVALNRLSNTFSESFAANLAARVQNNTSNLSELEPILSSLPHLPAYQEFRLHVLALPEEALNVFAILRRKQNELKAYPRELLEDIMRRLITREGCLAWKEHLEQRLPVLRIVRKELARKIENLSNSIEKMRLLNRRFLTLSVEMRHFQTSEDWESMTRLRGPRARRLREVFDMGLGTNLLQFRPVWLMNPDTASQLLPLRPGLFDIVIFDEASQILVEDAVPSLYRAKRAIICGDEKQLPPNNAFMKTLSDDDGESYEGELEEGTSECEGEESEDSWNQREIKDCPDLLTLGKTILPKTMLQIHYRSKYRELISFSNAAFYNGKLNVPVRHPDLVIKNMQPIQVVRVQNGVYQNQTNRSEAEKVVELLAEIWNVPNPPSIGVITFNAKQAELIEDILEERAEKDPCFQRALSNERERKQDGEDMGFFVKNVENVQGDERDLVIFSSTFGRDPEGSFKRHFGLLSQVGGEHRLNVAITRAREKIVLVTSLPINEISDALAKNQVPKIARDYLQSYFNYATKISDGSPELARNCLNLMTPDKTVQTSPSARKDGFMRSVASVIEGFGLKPLTVVDKDVFGLDFVIEDHLNKRFGIGIECDAHCHSMLDTASAREVWRPKVLSKVIPNVHRITSYGWYHQREEEMKLLKHALEKSLATTLERRPLNAS